MRREQELERKLHEAEQRIVAAARAGIAAGAQDDAHGNCQLLAKQGVDDGGFDGCWNPGCGIAGLSLEQRIAVKSQLLRAGVVAVAGDGTRERNGNARKPMDERLPDDRRKEE